TYAPVMGRMNVSHLEARAFARQSAWPQGREASLVSNFRQRISLVHELGKLRGSEELLNYRGGRFVVHQLLRHKRLDILQAHALFYRALHAHQANSELVFHQFANRTHAAVAEMIDIVNLTIGVTVFQLD